MIQQFAYPLQHFAYPLQHHTPPPPTQHPILTLITPYYRRWKWRWVIKNVIRVGIIYPTGVLDTEVGTSVGTGALGVGTEALRVGTGGIQEQVKMIIL